MSMSAPVEHSLVMIMLTALTLLAVSCAIASLDTLGMVSLVKVCRAIFIVDFTMFSYSLSPADILSRTK